jgi:hypothetical protein
LHFQQNIGVDGISTNGDSSHGAAHQQRLLGACKRQTREMTTLEYKLRELGSIHEVVAERKPLVGEKPTADCGKGPMQGGVMKYVTVIALVVALIAYIRAGVLECKVMGEALSPRCLLLGASLAEERTSSA